MSNADPRPGEVLAFEESEYLFGAGRVVVQVAEVGHRWSYRTDQFVTVSGTQLNANPQEMRTVEVKVAVLDLARRRNWGYR